MDKRDNLNMFKPGQSGNPKGRPKGSKSSTALLRRVLQDTLNHKDPMDNQERPMTNNEAVVLKLVKEAIGGNIRAITEIFNRVDGRVPFPIQHQEVPTTPAEVVSNLQKIADMEGIPLDVLCKREGIDMDRLRRLEAAEVQAAVDEDTGEDGEECKT